MQVGEGDDVGAATPGQPGQPQPAQHGGEADLDPGDIQPGTRGAGQQHIGDPGQSLTRHVDDLGVQQVTAEQDLGRVQGLGERADPEGAEVRAAQNRTRPPRRASGVRGTSAAPPRLATSSR